MPLISSPVLQAGIRSFTFHDGGGPVLERIGFAAAPGTLTAVLGASGSGKTTLGRLLAGWLAPGSGGTLHGYLELAGTRLDFGDGPTDGDAGGPHRGEPHIDPAAWGRHVGFVPQDAAAALSTVRATVAEELAFGLENAGVPRPAMVAAVERTAGLLGLTGLLNRNPARLSGGQQRRLAIGCAVISGPAVLVMDEPFASLDAAGALELAALVRHLVASGTAVVILSQVIDALLLAADQWLVLADGTVAAAGDPASLGPDTGLVPAGIRWVGGAGRTARPAARTTRPTAHPDFTEKVVVPAAKSTAAVHPAPRDPAGAGAALELRDVSFGYAPDARPPGSKGRWPARSRNAPLPATQPPVLASVSLAVHPGEIVAVTGPNGAGKSTLLRHLNGQLQPTRGAVLVNGSTIAGRAVGETAADVGLLFQHPRDQLFERTLQREVRFGLDRLVGSAAAGERAAAALAAVGLEGAAHGHPAELSASGQRLLALATVLARRPSVIALDEPTVALDGDGLAVLDAAVRSAAAEGAAVVLVTHDLDYARTAAHRLVALDGGRLTEC
ncbi:ABC transporter related [Pseudarthrobacter chlorophenolicus A6]|uniref:ABC transporter related n=1 Tax=Pseudarthrobacter chlorophenolicus (strain ATCC 700700 / DSM 12829 / CIP 107037 / JCM 12360 / KCTC 9906 / NCIMB 13794 / A6) TaxID=452863 RepID=B8HH44_PSECP|nr:ABC transporter ATP-binding protein [Pseudarthrobacter chlorophenolicus]ACL39633.1 ABC transporter related [Pseudarthrobacter chlorophenolicus A6]SDQ96256.1 energy-coupling factor transport system ATP-binding protein [Pseudarthrobacter chlorophenolicus]